jgi:hypothetical protein
MLNLQHNGSTNTFPYPGENHFSDLGVPLW